MPVEDTMNGEHQCYNRGCGKRYDPSQNNADACTFHPGEPFFHDAYKGWSCCNKKCIDFTEFLNIKGCTTSFHSNVKPPQPEKPKVNADDLIEQSPQVVVRASVSEPERPSIHTPMVNLPVSISSSIENEFSKLSTAPANNLASTEITIGTSCTHSGCSESFTGVQDHDEGDCRYHPGVPIFHEGLKFWSCCQKRTCEFEMFLQQKGCATDKHVWKRKEDDALSQSSCRYDWHQTGSHVVVSIYAKKYDPYTSSIQASPVKLSVRVLFPQGSSFSLDIELRGVIDVSQSSVSMLGTKVEIKLRKSEPFKWPKLEFDKPKTATAVSEPAAPLVVVDSTNTVEVETPVEAVDLSDL